MKKGFLSVGLSAVLASVLVGCGNAAGDGNVSGSQEQTVTLNIATAGDTNMADFFNDVVGPAFTERHPYFNLNIIATGPGDDGSRTITTMWDAQNSAGSEAWTIDMAVVHESAMETLIGNDLIVPFVPQIANAQFVNTPASRMSLGVNVEDFVVPLFQSQIVLAYNPDNVSNPPQTFDELALWMEANPNRFGYNGVVGGMSGVGFVAAWIYAMSGDYEAIALSEYDPSVTEGWAEIIDELRALPVVYTQGNAGTLDMLNRGEIDMGPVWVDMMLLWQADGRLNPSINMLLPAPGMPGQPMYLVIGREAVNADAARTFINFLAEPEIQARYIVEHSGWNPGIDPEAVFEVASETAIQQLFTDITAEQFAERGLAMPVGDFRTDMIRIFEESR